MAAKGGRAAAAASAKGPATGRRGAVQHGVDRSGRRRRPPVRDHYSLQDDYDEDLKNFSSNRCMCCSKSLSKCRCDLASSAYSDNLSDSSSSSSGDLSMGKRSAASSGAPNKTFSGPNSRAPSSLPAKGGTARSAPSAVDKGRRRGDDKSHQRAPIECAHCGLVLAMGGRRCSQCKSVAYCGNSCQKSHWKVHRDVCGLLSGKL